MSESSDKGLAARAKVNFDKKYALTKDSYFVFPLSHDDSNEWNMILNHKISHKSFTFSVSKGKFKRKTLARASRC